MKARWLVNLLLLVVLLVLGGLIRLELSASRATPTLGGLGTPEPHLIEISRAGEPTILIERLPSGWRMRAPWDVDADPERVAAVLAATKHIAESRSRERMMKEAMYSSGKLRSRLSARNEAVSFSVAEESIDVPAYLRRKPAQGKGDL